jgi:dipeptidase
MKTKKITLLFLLFLSFFITGSANAQQTNYFIPDEDFSESCTSIMVAKNASTDGSVMTAHTCDSNYRTWLDIVSGENNNEETVDPVYWGRLHSEEPWDMRNVVKKGEIPAAENTFAYLNTAYPCLNEKQLAIGETTIVGRKELVNKNGLFLIEELQRIALQRCSTSRDAVLLIGAYAEKYSYADAGECLTIADKNEIWQLEIFGPGEDNSGAIWVAQRIPDNHVAISANIPRIAKVDFNSPDFLYSSDIKEKCKKLGLWDEEDEFIFWKINNGKKPFSIREYFVLSTLAPSLGLSYDSEELPFSVKPDKKVSVRDVMALYRQTYEGTEWDQTKNLSVEVKRRSREEGEYTEIVRPVSNFMSADMRALLNKLKPGVSERVRGIAVIQCSYSHIIQLRDWLPDEIGGVAWFAFDNPAQSPRIPIYAGATQLPSSFNVCGQHRYREDAAIWSFRETNRVATINWNKTRNLLESDIFDLEDKLFDSASRIEKEALMHIEAGDKESAVKVLNDFTEDFASLTMKRWEELKAELWTIFARSM